MRISLSSYPSVNPTYTVSFPKLSGGLNLKELDYRLEADESPEMRNLWWQDGVLQCRDGQVYVSDDSSLGKGITCYESLFYGFAFLHIGGALYYGDPTDVQMPLRSLTEGVPENRGTFFRYQDFLFYKNKGAFLKITYQPNEEELFSVSNILDDAYTPVIVINAAPQTGSGDYYQPENRLSPKKEIRYNAASGVKEYHLPVTDIDAVVKVVVDGKTLSPDSDYQVDLAKGTVAFTAAPPVTEPATNNTVVIVYEKANPDARNAVLDCPYAIVSGGDTNLCILLGGCPAQPNAVFWNSNDSLAMNCAYFPITYYNLVGDTEDPVTGFGKQYSTTLVLKQHSIGKLTYGVEKVDDRDSISFSYADVNARVGCDLPWTIQLVENNLVWANSYQGVHMLRSASAAFENNVECISAKINGELTGLLPDLRSALVATSFDDGDRYWLCTGNAVYIWDYALSTFSEPSWFYFTNIPAVSLFRDNEHRLYHLDSAGRVTRFERVFSDYDSGIDKFYRFPTQYFGSYERLKDVLAVLFSVRSDTDTDIKIQYTTDYERRDDLTPIRTYSWRLSPRNLAHRCLDSARFAHVAKRKPGCRHVRHFTVSLENSSPGEDLSVVTAQILYRYQGKER